jgi:hypothetical protein
MREMCFGVIQNIYSRDLTFSLNINKFTSEIDEIHNYGVKDGLKIPSSEGTFTVKYEKKKKKSVKQC